MDEQQPVAEGEFVYRRIHRNYYQAGLPMPVAVAAFRPTDLDTTGLSVFREPFVKAVDVLAGIADDKKNNYYVARLAVSDLRKLGLSVLPRPDPDGPPGHAEIPELSSAAYQADKQRLKQIQVELAKLASQGIVHQPS
ncbi:MAG TPA: hypothetical protein VEL76_34740 [Gemmataceae bacterium]|nr:hypothetical protein [Gemmataceae bacterium]